MTIILSIKPYYLYLILIGKKTIELRKSFPQRKEWDRTAFLYCTKDKKSFAEIPEEDQGWMRDKLGKIACKVLIDKCCTFIPTEYGIKTKGIHSARALHDSRLRIYQIKDYLKDAPGYGWHITDLVIYDKPRELSEFKRDCDGNCQSCQYAIWQTSGLAYEPYIVDCKPITRPPQSWCYVEELGV